MLFCSRRGGATVARRDRRRTNPPTMEGICAGFAAHRRAINCERTLRPRRGLGRELAQDRSSANHRVVRVSDNVPRSPARFRPRTCLITTTPSTTACKSTLISAISAPTYLSKGESRPLHSCHRSLERRDGTVRARIDELEAGSESVRH